MTPIQSPRSTTSGSRIIDDSYDTWLSPRTSPPLPGRSTCTSTCNSQLREQTMHLSTQDFREAEAYTSLTQRPIHIVPTAWDTSDKNLGGSSEEKRLSRSRKRANVNVTDGATPLKRQREDDSMISIPSSKLCIIGTCSQSGLPLFANPTYRASETDSSGSKECLDLANHTWQENWPNGSLNSSGSLTHHTSKTSTTDGGTITGDKQSRSSKTYHPPSITMSGGDTKTGSTNGASKGKSKEVHWMLPDPALSSSLQTSLWGEFSEMFHKHSPISPKQTQCQDDLNSSRFTGILMEE